MSDTGSNRPPIKLNVLDVMSNWLFADPVANSKRRPNLRIKVLGNVPRFQVRTNVDGDKNNGRLEFNLDLLTFGAIMNTISDLAEGRASQGLEFEYRDDFVAGKKLDSAMTLARLKVDKDPQSGRIYIALLGAPDRPKIRFFFGPSRYHNIKHVNGQQVSDAELSAAYARAFVSEFTPLVRQLLVENFDENAKNVPKAPGEQGAGGQRGGFQKRRYDNSGGSQRNSGGDFGDVEDFDADFSY